MPTILVIEDELAVRQNLLALLKAEGFQAIGAEDGQVGLQLAQTHLPDLIICDVMMPKLGGFEVLEILQQNAATAIIPFIFLTAKTERSDFRQGMRLGADDYLTKPFTRVELLETIKMRLSKHHGVAQLKQQLAELEQSNLLKDDFVSTVAHELRAPLTNIKMAISLLQNAPDANRQQRYIELLQAECSREFELINDLLDLQRLEQHHPALPLEVLDLQEWLLPMVQTFQVRSQQRQQTMEVMISPTLAPVAIHPPSLHRLLTELLNNACKYTPPEGLIRLEMGLTRENQTGVLQITVGNSAEIPPKAIPHLFDRFYRVPGSDRWQQGGSGLGLALVQKLVESLRGTIQVSSHSGWTRFMVSLPSGC